DRSRQILADSIGEVDLVGAAGRIEHDLIMQVAFHHHDAAMVWIVIAVRDRSRRGVRRGRRGAGCRGLLRPLRSASDENGNDGYGTRVRQYVTCQTFATKTRKHET